MRLAALTVLIIGNLLANQVYAEDVSTQPLTRVDCDNAKMAWDENANVCIANSGNVSRQPLTRLSCESAGMVWNDTANVCGEATQAAEARPEAPVAQPMRKSEVADTLIQPLTRHACDNVGLTWNDTTNVCGERSDELAIQTEPRETNPVTSTVLINIDKASQKMTVFLDGLQRYEWPVSTGLRGYTTPSGTYTASSMNEIWYSKQWDNAPMPHAVFFTREGHAIHGTNEIKRLGKPASHGCVRISPQNAATLYALVAKTGLKNTQVVLAGLTPGGEGKVAAIARSKSSYRQSSRSFKRGNNYYADSYQRPRGGGFFRRLFGGP